MAKYSVQRLGRGFAIVVPTGDGKRTRIRLAAKDRSSAEAEARTVFADLTREDWTVGRVVNEYIDERERAGIASTSRQRDAWKAMQGFWENVDPAMIDEPMVRKYADGRKAGPATIRYELSMLSVALRRARDAKAIDAAPAIWRPAVPERRVRHLTHKEFEAWFAEVKAPHARLYALLGLYSMARPSAILELTWDRVDFERSQIDLNPKGRRQTKKRRPVVALNDDAMEALKEAHAGKQCEFVIERGAQPIKSMKKAFQAASKRSGIHVTPYTLRHTGAVWAAEAGVPMAELAQFMGHDDDSTTQTHYARFSPGFLKGVADKVRRAEK
jgi:integrase